MILRHYPTQKCEDTCLEMRYTERSLKPLYLMKSIAKGNLFLCNKRNRSVNVFPLYAKQFLFHKA